MVGDAFPAAKLLFKTLLRNHIIFSCTNYPGFVSVQKFMRVYIYIYIISLHKFQPFLMDNLINTPPTEVYYIEIELKKE